MKSLFFTLVMTLALTHSGISQTLSSRAPFDDCSYYTICVNMSDLIDKTNAHYFLFLDKGQVLVKPTGENFEHDEILGKLIPRQFSDSRRVNDFMLLFKLDLNAYEELNGLNFADFELKLNLKERLPNGTLIDIPSHSFSFTLKPKSFFNLSEKIVLHEASPILMSYPENLTIPAISLDIQDKLSGLQFYYEFDTTSNLKGNPMDWQFKEAYVPTSHQDSAYVRASKLLDELELKNTATTSLKLDQIDDLMKLYLFTKEYLMPGSYFKEEATKLEASISVMEFEKEYLENDSLKALLLVSRNSMEQYKKTIDRLRSCHIRSKIVLFQNGVLPKPDQDEYILIKRTGDDRDSMVNRESSFGAFVIPARFRLNSTFKFVNDISLGASFHYPIKGTKCFDLVVGLGISALTTDSLLGENNSKVAAFSQMAGIAYAPMGNHFELGLFLGLDTGRYLKTKSWISIGAAYRLSSNRHAWRPKYGFPDDQRGFRIREN